MLFVFKIFIPAYTFKIKGVTQPIPTTIINIKGLCLSEQKVNSLRKQNGLGSNKGGRGGGGKGGGGRGHGGVDVHEELEAARQLATELRSELASTRIGNNVRLDEELQKVRLLEIELERLKHEMAVQVTKTEEAQANVSMLEAEKSNAEWIGKARSPEQRKKGYVDEDDVDDALKQAEQALKDIESDHT